MIVAPRQLADFEETFVRALRRDVRRRRVRVTSAALLAIILLAGGTALADSDLFDVAAVDEASAPPASTSIVDLFRTLGEPAPGDTLPASVPVDARSLGQGVYVAPRDGTLCVIAIPGAAQCGRTFKNGIILDGSEQWHDDPGHTPAKVELDGVAQDDVRAVVVTLSDGHSIEAVVQTNGFRATVPNAAFEDITVIGVVHRDGTVIQASPRDYGLVTAHVAIVGPSGGPVPPASSRPTRQTTNAP